jgi:hypothetical protein
MKVTRDVSGEHLAETHLAETLCRRRQYSRVINSAAISSSKPKNLHISELPFRITALFELAHSILWAVSNHKGVTREAIGATL